MESAIEDIVSNRRLQVPVEPLNPLLGWLLLAECRRSSGTASSECLDIKYRVDAYQNLRKTYPGYLDLSFANARKTVNFAILD